jgi:cysteine desulfurase
VVFTAGGTEADNLAVKGGARLARDAGRGDGVVTTAFEHKGVLASCDRLEAEGFRVIRLGVPASGVLDPAAVAAAVDDRTVMVSVMLVNNEVGTIQPLAEIARRVRERAPQALLHTDAVQAVPWLDVAVAAADVDLVAISAHKFGGPKGTGALIVRGNASVEPLLEGGGQERGLRSGTSNVAGAVAMAAALRVTCDERDADVARTVRPRSPGTRTSDSAGSTRRCCSSRSTRQACSQPRGRRARRAPPSPRTCSWRWAWATRRGRRSGSASATRRPTTTSTSRSP